MIINFNPGARGRLQIFVGEPGWSATRQQIRSLVCSDEEYRDAIEWVAMYTHKIYSIEDVHALGRPVADDVVTMRIGEKECARIDIAYGEWVVVSWRNAAEDHDEKIVYHFLSEFGEVSL